MKIIHVSDSYAPTIGGLERSIQTLARAQKDAGNDVIVIAATHPDEPAERDDDGVKILRRDMFVQKVPGAISDPRRAFHPPIVDPLFRHNLEKIFRGAEPDIIHAHGWNMFSVRAAAAKLGIPCVSTAHDYGHACAVKQSTFADGTVCLRPELAKCVRHANQHYGPKGIAIALSLWSSIAKSRDAEWTAVSNAVAHQADGSEFEIPNMRVIPSYCPDSIMSALDAARPEFVPEGEYMLFVGALVPVKGLQVLLQAQKELWAEGLRIPLHVIGAQHGESVGVPQEGVTYAYNQGHDKVMGSWRHASLGVVPSVVPEAFGQVVVECMAAKTPVIASRHGGIVDIVEEGVQGLLVEPNRVDDLKRAIKELWLDPERREKMGRAGRARAGKFVVSKVMPMIDEAYLDVIAKTKASSLARAHVSN